MVSAACAMFERPSKPVSNWTVEDARAFNQFPLYWVGETYEGLPLTSMRRIVDGDGVRHAIFNYGEPSFAGDAVSGSWIPPLEIDIQPYCGYSPEEFLSNDEYWDEDWNAEPVEVHIRGVNGYLQRYSSRNASLFLWSGDSTIHLRTWKSSLDIEDAARDLVPIAQGAATSAATTVQPFPPPTTNSC